ncbi:aminomethyl-transferring glycine dehydrogenase subunit GcvPA [candidate division KSB1 bacterium]|nr:aminomethyl-transferring glycine dehydrogenase subunit GcvPA [candidate division KSB1 bacterium]
MPFIPNTDDDRREMLKTIGVKRFDDLIANIPDKLRFKGQLKLPQPMSELEITHWLQTSARHTVGCDAAISFLGAGAYDHFIPAAIDHIVSRSEFYTAYTPYQPEVSQGTLQIIYEYQSLIAELTAMDVANASMYDGSSALAEACLMALSSTRRNKIILPKSLHPNYRRVIHTYVQGMDVRIELMDTPDGIIDADVLSNHIDGDTAAVVVQHPNFFGCLENVTELESLIHKQGALFITSNDPISLALLEPPGAYGADIVTAEGQVLGNALNFGGPYLGVLATREKFIRTMPGRLAGMTTDAKGRDGFVLTFQTREQHIRREKATSNICTNQALNALAATVYLALLGKQGMIDVANLCLQNSHYLADQLVKLTGFKMTFPHPFFKEFAITVPEEAERLLQQLANENIMGGVHLQQFDANLPNTLLIAVTEKRTKDELNRYVEIAKTFKSII